MSDEPKRNSEDASLPDNNTANRNQPEVGAIQQNIKRVVGDVIGQLNYITQNFAPKSMIRTFLILGSVLVLALVVIAVVAVLYLIIISGKFEASTFATPTQEATQNIMPTLIAVQVAMINPQNTCQTLLTTLDRMIDSENLENVNVIFVANEQISGITPTPMPQPLNGIFEGNCSSNGMITLDVKALRPLSTYDDTIEPENILVSDLSLDRAKFFGLAVLRYLRGAPGEFPDVTADYILAARDIRSLRELLQTSRTSDEQNQAMQSALAFLEGNSWLYAGCYVDAIDAYNAGIEQDLNNTAIHNNRGVAYINLGLQMRWLSILRVSESCQSTVVDDEFAANALENALSDFDTASTSTNSHHSALAYMNSAKAHYTLDNILDESVYETAVESCQQGLNLVSAKNDLNLQAKANLCFGAVNARYLQELESVDCEKRPTQLTNMSNALAAAEEDSLLLVELPYWKALAADIELAVLDECDPDNTYAAELPNVITSNYEDFLRAASEQRNPLLDLQAKTYMTMTFLEG